MKSYVLSFISSVGIVALGHADSLAHPSVSSPACSPTAYALPSRYPHNQAHGGHEPSPSCTAGSCTHLAPPKYPSCSFRSIASSVGCTLLLVSSVWKMHRQSGSHNQTHSQKVTQDQVGIQTPEALWPDPHSGVCGQAVVPKAPPKKGKFWTIQAGFKENHARMYSRLLGFHLGLKQTVPDSST